MLVLAMVTMLMLVDAGAGSVGMLRSTWSLGRRVMGLGFRHARPVVGSLLLP